VLTLYTFLGLACSIAYWLTGSLWTITILHWLAMSAWILRLGGMHLLQRTAKSPVTQYEF
jgi:predicted Abi (CAAX) family protease